MDQSLFTGQMLISATALLGLGGVLVSMGKLIQKVDQLHKDLEGVKDDIDSVRKEMLSEETKRESWQERTTNKLGEMSERTTTIEAKLSSYIGGVR
jgi:FtsZ-binding cell division protein ZapB